MGSGSSVTTLPKRLLGGGLALGVLAGAGWFALDRVAGRLVDDLRPELEALIDTLDIRPIVDIVPWQEHAEVIRMMQCAHILVAPSVTADNGDQEGIPNVLKEAMALGLPIPWSRLGQNFGYAAAFAAAVLAVGWVFFRRRELT